MKFSFQSTLLTFCFIHFGFIAGIFGQTIELSGNLKDDTEVAVSFANVALYESSTNALIKVEISNENGQFSFKNLNAGVYNLEASFVGYNTLKMENISLIDNEKKALGNLILSTDAVELETAIVSAKRAMVEIKPDRTVFNVEGTINSAGDNALGLLRKAPGVLVDNNNNLSVLSRSGVLVYVDGKRLPLTGDALTNYLTNLPAEQIDRMDIITNPGAKYEAEGNAGIIDIRLKKDKNLGSNASLSGNFSQGRYATGGGTVSGNYRNKKMNTFATLGANAGNRFNDMDFLNFQNGLLIDEYNFSKTNSKDGSIRFGTDFFISKNHTLGFLVTGGRSTNNTVGDNYSEISKGLNSPIDSILIANNNSEGSFSNGTVNLNYVWNGTGKSLNIDADYGNYDNTKDFSQPNRYYLEDRQTLLTEVLTSYQTPSNIQIATFKVDFEKDLFGGKFGIGSKVSKVVTDNTFEFTDIVNNIPILNLQRSNNFIYDENVYAFYVSYARKLSEKWNFSGGLRSETTNATGELTPYEVSLQEPAINLDYTTLFPNVGFTYQFSPMQVFSLNYGSRINRPDYNVLNPFREQLSELSFSKGNPNLQPEIVHNVELGYTLFYRFNFKLAYSKTYDQITRLIAPDDKDPRAGFITWANLAEQDIISFNASLPFDITKWWSAYINASASTINNQAVYSDGGIVDVQAYTYNFFQQHTFKLPKKFSGEISGWYSGPGVWGGVFLYDPSYSLNLGLQRKFLNDQMNVKLSVNDIFYESGWSGESSFNGLVSEGRGNWDSRRASIAISYNLGNKNVKSRRRETGLENESKRVGN